MRALEWSARRDSWLAVPIARVLAQGGDARFGQPVRVPLEWLDETACARMTVVQAAREGCSHGPRIRGRQSMERVALPALSRYEFSDARVSAASSSILLADRLVVERTPGADVSRCNYAAGHLLAHGDRTAIVGRGREEHVHRGVFLGGNGAFNYYHWMLELLPKLEFVDDLEVPLLVSDDVARIPTFREALALVAGTRAILLMEHDVTYRVSRLLHVASPTTCPFNLRRGEEFRIRDFLLRPSAIEFLRHRLVDTPGARLPEVRRRLFLARSPVRRDYNQDEIFAILCRHGFEKVHMEELSLREQIDAVRAAEMIAGPTGAAWTNLLFAQAGTRCLCWMAEEQSGFAGYSNLAHAVGADLRYLTYRTGVQDSEALYAMGYRLDPEEVAREMSRLVE